MGLDLNESELGDSCVDGEDGFGGLRSTTTALAGG